MGSAASTTTTTRTSATPSPRSLSPDNLVFLRGHVSSPPRRRSLPSGSVLLQLEVTTRTDGVAVSVPVVWFDPPARASVSAATAVDTEVVVTGQVRRRYFRAGGVTQSRTEVVAVLVVTAGRTREVERALARAIDALATAEA